MEGQKPDRRKSPAFRHINACFLEMLKKKSIDQISVGELCEKLSINRSTFYRHYADIYALLDSIVDDCFSELFSLPVSQAEAGGSFEEMGYQHILNVCTVAEQKKELYQQLLFGRTNTQLMQRLTEATYQLYLSAHEGSDYIPTEEATLHYHFLANGIIGIWVAWLRDDCVIPKELVAKAAMEQITAFFGKMTELYWTEERKKR